MKSPSDQAHTMPLRYFDYWQKRLVRLALLHASPGDHILDIGGSDRPVIPRDQRPADVTYVGLDIDAAGLKAGDYDERIVSSVEASHKELLGRFDVVVSLHTFEHVANLEHAFSNIRSYLKPDGAFAALFSGRWSAFAVPARMMPHAVRVKLLVRVLGDPPDEKFPLRYDRCSYRQLAQLTEDWSEPVIVPLYRAAEYFRFAPRLQRAFLTYEARAISHPNLASHYLVTARRPPSMLPTEL